MTEKETWIEREAAEARARFWGVGDGEWDYADDMIKSDWRRVVAPFYPEPPVCVPKCNPEPVADADTLEKLAEIGEKAYNADKSNLVDEKWISATKAILRAAKPEPIQHFSIRAD